MLLNLGCEDHWAFVLEKEEPEAGRELLSAANACSISPVPLLTKPNTAPAGKTEMLTGSISNIIEQRRVDLELRCNKLITDTMLLFISSILSCTFKEKYVSMCCVQMMIFNICHYV